MLCGVRYCQGVSEVKIKFVDNRQRYIGIAKEESATAMLPQEPTVQLMKYPADINSRFI